MSAAEQRRLLAAYRDRGDRRAKDRLVEANRGLVNSIVADLTRRHLASRRTAGHHRDAADGAPVEREDLKQEGFVALLEAIDGFDPDRGVALSTYAYAAVRNAVFRTLKSSRYMPGRKILRKKISAYIGACEELRLKLRREPSRAEIAERLGEPEEKLRSVEIDMMVGASPLSFEYLLERGVSRAAVRRGLSVASDGADHGFLLGPAHVLSAEEEMLLLECEREAVLLPEIVGRSLAALGDGDRVLIHDLYGLGGTEKITAVAAARKKDVCRARVYQIKDRAERHLKESLSAGGIEDGFARVS